jgi:hypothetical protein
MISSACILIGTCLTRTFTFTEPKIIDADSIGCPNRSVSDGLRDPSTTPGLASLVPALLRMTNS